MVMSMAVMLGAARGRRFSIPDRSGHLFRHARRHPRRRARRLAPVDAGRHADQLGEAAAEGAQRRAADREADLGDAEVATAQQRHRALDAPRHQVAVRRLAVGEPELAAEVPGRHVRAAGERLDVQRLRVLPVEPIANAAQPRKVAQVLHRSGSAGHPRDRATSAPELPSAAGVPPHSAWRNRPVIEGLADGSLDRQTEPVQAPGWPEPRSYPVRECLLVVLNEEWEHRLYAERDLDALEARNA